MDREKISSKSKSKGKERGRLNYKSISSSILDMCDDNQFFRNVLFFNLVIFN